MPRLLTSIFPLIDGPPLPRAVLADLSEQRELVTRMAADLRRLDALGGEAEAVRALSACPYRMDDVARFAGQALFEARLDIVGRIMRAN